MGVKVFRKVEISTDIYFGWSLRLVVREANETFKQALQIDFDNLSTEATKATEAARAHLASMNLPAALDAIQPDVGIPGDVWERIQDTQRKGGSKAVDVRFQFAILSTSSLVLFLDPSVIIEVDDCQNRLRQSVDRCTTATEAARAHLASINLPAALDAIQPDVGIPGDVWERNPLSLKCLHGPPLAAFIYRIRSLY